MPPRRSRFRPSELGRLHLCPGSHVLQTLYETEETDSEDAAEGTMLHAVLAGEKNLTKLTEEQAEMVSLCETYLESLLDAAAEGGYGDWTVRHEVPVALESDGVLLLEGTADIVATHLIQPVAHVTDWKFGRQEIPEAAVRYQLMAYGAAVLSTFGASGLRTCIATAYQPRCLKQYRLELSLATLDAAVAEIQAVMHRAEDTAHMTLNPSPEACLRCYCPVLGHCPAARSLAGELAVEPVKGWTAVPTAKLARLADKAKVVQEQAELVLQALKHRLRGGDTDRHWTLQTRQGRKRIGDPREAFVRVKERVGIDGFLRAVSVNPGALEEEWSKKREKGVTKKDAVSELHAALGDVLQRGEDTVALVRKET